VPPAPGFLEALRKLTEDNGSLLIFDEIITGFRVPEFGVQNIINIMPDLTCLGKIIGGGLPVGAVGGRRDVMEMLAPVGPVYQAGTLSGNPLAMAAGVATLNKLTEAAYKKLDDSASRLANGFKDAAAEAGLGVSVSRLGSVLGLFFSPGLPSNLDEVQATRSDLYPGFFHGMLSRGDYFAPSAFEAIFVSNAHTADIVDATIANAREVFSGLASN
jgi:glutamate-1-semialdehyde 2,1-aminomutase